MFGSIIRNKRFWYLVICFGIIRSIHALPKQVVIIRHAERYPDSGSSFPVGQLNAQGLKRAGVLASYLTLLDPTTTNVAFLINGPPTVIFAAKPYAAIGNTTRCIQTITPTATTLQLPIYSPFRDFQESEFANLILNDPRYNGQNVLICWHSETIGALIEAFGYHFPYIIYPERFDLVWFLPFPVPYNRPTITPIVQKVLFDDPVTLS